MILLIVILLILLSYNNAYHNIGSNNKRTTFLKNRLITIEEAKESFQQWNDASSLGKYDNDNDDDNTFIINENNVGESVSEYLSKQCTFLGTKNRVHKVCRSGFVLRNGGLVYSSAKLVLDDVLKIDKKAILKELNVTNILNDVDLGRLVSYTNSLLSENHNPCYHTLYEDDNLAVVFKPAGVHSLRWTGTIKRRLFALDDCLPLLLKATPVTNVNDINEDISLPRPIPQHRLDARVAGCLVVAKSRRAAVNLHKQFEQRKIKKEYRAILVGKINTDNPRKKIVITHPVDGLSSTTELIIMQETKCPVYGCLTTVRLFPLTGRRHQLRRHCAALGNPIVGDNLYHYASFATSLEQRLLNIQEVSDTTKTATEIINSKKQIDMDEDLNTSFSDNDNDAITSNDDEDIILNDSSIPSTRADIPALRKCPLYLMAIAVEMNHPLDNDKVLRVEAEELPRFKKIIDKASSGWTWGNNKNNPNGNDDIIISYI